MRENTPRQRRTSSSSSKPRRSTSRPNEATRTGRNGSRNVSSDASNGRRDSARNPKSRTSDRSASRGPSTRPATRTRSDSSSNPRSRSERPRPTSSRPRRDDATRPRRSATARSTDGRDSRPSSRSRSERDNRTRPERSTSRNSERRPTSSRRDADRRTSSSSRPVRQVQPQKPALAIPQDVDLSVVPKSVLAEIRLIAPHTQDLVKQYLAVAITAIESAEFDRAYDYAREARTLASRLATVREIAGLAAYYAGKWAEALSEFKTYMRMTGDPHFLPIMADCERGLNRPERAIALSKNRSVQDLDAAGKIEMRIVVSGARRDLRQFENALVILEIPELRSGKRSIEVARLRYAYAEVLLAMGRKTEARDWFVKASLADIEEETDASERALKLGDV